jgi:thymidylate synthase
MLTTRFRSLDEVQRSALTLLFDEGVVAAPRGQTTLELPAVSFTLEDPRRRCITNTARHWSLPLAIGELCWHLSANTQASALAYYAPIWSRFAGPDGQVTGSCYGFRVFQIERGHTLWDRVRLLLEKDPATRRAILYFPHGVDHLDQSCTDSACASSLQFLLRSGSLDAVISMRSNDAVWGLPYDVFLFTFLQERMAHELGVELGAYHHFAGSLHLYERHANLARRVIECGAECDFCMPPLTSLRDIDCFSAFERTLRTRGNAAIPTLNRYWHELAEVLLAFHTNRKEWPEALRAFSPSNRYLNLMPTAIGVTN